MHAIEFGAPGNASLVDRPEPVAAADEVVLAVEAAGLCGTDIHSFHGTYPSPYPFVPGHEFAGRVLHVGSNVDPDLIGRRFAAHPLDPCGRCGPCHAGRINFCHDLGVYGGNHQGGFAERVAVRARCLHPLPDGLTSDIAVFAEPLACVLHGLDRIGVQSGDRACCSARDRSACFCFRPAAPWGQARSTCSI